VWDGGHIHEFVLTVAVEIPASVTSPRWPVSFCERVFLKMKSSQDLQLAQR